MNEEYFYEELQYEIDDYLALPYVFAGFYNIPLYTNGEIEVICKAKNPAVPEKKHVPSYNFDIIKNNIRIGEIGLRIGYTVGLYYCGNIGYSIKEEYRGHSYAEKACRMIIPVMKMHKMEKVIITNEQNNISSKRVCEKLGAEFIHTVPLPTWTDLYAEGQRFVNIYEWTI